MPIRTFQYRLYPTKAQKEALQLQLDVSRHVYNMALEERKLAWEYEEQSIGKKESYPSLFPPFENRRKSRLSTFQELQTLAQYRL